MSQSEGETEITEQEREGKTQEPQEQETQETQEQETQETQEQETQKKQEQEEQEEQDDDDDDDDDDEPDEWDQRIEKTGCAKENLALQLCHYDTGDWRKCIDEMDAFRKCWAQHQNNERTHVKDNDISDF